MLKYAKCGGELAKSKRIRGRYKCIACGKVVKLGTGFGYMGHPGYIKAQKGKV